MRPAGAAWGATASTASARATPAAATVSQTASRSIGGRSTTDSSNELPGGATHARPSRPRPSVCSSATTVAPSGAPEAASSAALAMVVGTLAATSRGLKNPGRARRTQPAPVTSMTGAAYRLRRCHPVLSYGRWILVAMHADSGRRYRAYPTPGQAGRLTGWGHSCRAVWNLALEQRR
ncbi:MAG TPA: helix-turn-helix domain-containing protein, partial [Actinomycetes bacterium]|nr:helix-turn-helix domain-containing protein [Actinomycetes bacterium]